MNISLKSTNSSMLSVRSTTPSPVVNTNLSGASPRPQPPLLKQSTKAEIVPLKLFDQDYEEIQARLQSRKQLFEDDKFPANDASLFSNKSAPRQFIWKRPGELVRDPELYIGGASRFDITQGLLGDCWLLAAMAGLSQHEALLNNVIVPGQDFSTNYCGMFRFRFWQFGRWVEVVIDDRLPTYNGKLVFSHSISQSEFWSALLEKAYAKLCGCYETLKGGQTAEAMEDFTGGVIEVFELSKAPPNLFNLLTRAFQFNSLAGCSIDAKPNEVESKLSNGLIKGHAYTITDLQKVTLKNRSSVELIRIRNPWGNEREWTGAWGDRSVEWNQLDGAERERLGLTFDDDGEFWMSFADFKQNFHRVELCLLSPENMPEDEGSIAWEVRYEHNSWRKAITAGGCRNFIDTFHINPQLRVNLVDPDEDDDDPNTGCSLIVALMQKDRRKQKQVGAQNLTVGFVIYKMDEQSQKLERLDKNYFMYHQSTARSDSFINSREVSTRFKLPPASYVIIPSSYAPGEEGDFLLRIYSEKPHHAQKMDHVTTITQQALPKPVGTSAELDAKFKSIFQQVSGQDGEVDCFELRQLLNAAFSQEFRTLKSPIDFSLETSRSLIAMMDKDHSGNLDFSEFKEVWSRILQWKAIFKQFDKDNSNDMDVLELREALSRLGFVLSTTALTALVLRYASKKGTLNLDDFFQCITKVQSSFDAYCAHEAPGKGFATFDLDSYIQTSVYI